MVWPASSISVLRRRKLFVAGTGSLGALSWDGYERERCSWLFCNAPLCEGDCKKTAKKPIRGFLTV